MFRIHTELTSVVILGDAVPNMSYIGDYIYKYISNGGRGGVITSNYYSLLKGSRPYVIN